MPFEPIYTDVTFLVNTGKFKGDMSVIRADYAATTGAMTDETLKLALAQDKVTRGLMQGPSSPAAARATTNLRNVQQQLLAQQRAAQLAGGSTVQALSKIEPAAHKAGRSISTYVTAPLLVVGYEATKMSIEFQRQMQLVQTQAGASAAEVEHMTGAVLQLAHTAPQGPVELAKGLYHLESLGLRGANALHALKISAMAAGMGIANLEDVTSALGGAVVTGIKGTEDYSAAMNGLVAIAGQGNMRMEDLTAALGTGVLPAAKNAGLGMRDFGAALAVLTDRGMGAEESGTRLRMTFALMQHESGAAKKSLADMGITGDTLAKTLREPDGLLKALELLHDHMLSVGQIRGARDILGAFGGGRSGAAIMTLVQSLDSSVSSYQQKLVGYDQGVADAAQKAAVYQQSAAYKIAKDWSSVQADMTKAGNTIAPIAVHIADAIGTVADAFDRLPSGVKAGIGIELGVVAVVGPLLLVAAAATRGVLGIRSAFIKLGGTATTTIAATEAQLGGLAAAAGTTAAEVGVAAATTETEIAGIGGAAAAATGEARLLRTTLLGLGALAIAPIVIPLVIKGGQDLSGWLGKHIGHGVGDTPLPDGVSFDDLVKLKNDQKKGHLDSADVDTLDALNGGYLPYSDVTGGAGQHGALQTNADRRKKKLTKTDTGYKPSRSAALDLALAKNPNDLAAIKAKLAYDAEAAAYAEKKIAAGHGSPQTVQALKGVYQDEESLRQQIAQITSKNAADLKKHFDPLTKVPVKLQQQESLATIHHAPTSKILTILRAEAKAMRDQVAELRKEHAPQSEIADALKTSAGVKTKIAALIKTEATKKIAALTDVPIDLRIAEANARARNASAQTILGILNKEKAALEAQLVKLKAMGGTKAQILKNRQNEAAVETKIKNVKGSGSGADFFTEAAQEAELYGSTITGPGGILSGQQGRALLADISRTLTSIDRHSKSTAGHTESISKNHRTSIDDARYAATHGW